MCLSRITKRITKKIEQKEKVECYVVLIKFKAGHAPINPETGMRYGADEWFRPNKLSIRRHSGKFYVPYLPVVFSKKIIADSSRTIACSTGQTYLAGFHRWVTLEDARNYADVLLHRREGVAVVGVFRCTVSDIRTIGYNAVGTYYRRAHPGSGILPGIYPPRIYPPGQCVVARVCTIRKNPVQTFIKDESQ